MVRGCRQVSWCAGGGKLLDHLTFAVARPACGRPRAVRVEDQGAAGIAAPATAVTGGALLVREDGPGVALAGGEKLAEGVP